ncbi:unnamed protein product [Symbiodinium natans]|uniref:Uncharacterized protein n=1 Tax=Symbiodinium natans TaxID=878477 RepID=A0A812GXT6_9DINO|nr:unnamed protein product [Symbiodinium natans]
MVRSHVQGLQMNVENRCGCHMHPDKVAMVPPPVSSTLMARAQTDRTISQPSLPSTGEQVTKAQRAGAVALKKARAMMPAVDLQPTVPNSRSRHRRRAPRSSTRPENR